MFQGIIKSDFFRTLFGDPLQERQGFSSAFPLHVDLCKKIFSFLPGERDQQNLTIVNKFWSVCIIDVATKGQIEKIRTFIFDLSHRLKVNISDQNKNAYEETISNLDKLNSGLCNEGCLTRSSLGSFKNSAQTLQKSLITLLKELPGLEKIDYSSSPILAATRMLDKGRLAIQTGNPSPLETDPPLTPLPKFLFNNVMALAFIHYEHENSKNIWRLDYNEWVSESFAEENEYHMALQVAKTIPHNERSLYQIISIALKNNLFQWAEKAAEEYYSKNHQFEEYNPSYKIAHFLIEKKDYKPAEKYIVKTIPALQVELYGLLAKSLADSKQFLEARAYCHKIKIISPHTLYNPLQYVKQREKEHAAQMANRASVQA